MSFAPSLVPSRRQFLQVLAAAGLSTAAGRVPAFRSRAQAAALFEEVPAGSSGITWVHENAMSADRYLPETMGPGVAFFDYDNDGWMDIFMVNSGPSDFYTPKAPLRNALYHNNRDGTFTDVTEKAGVAGGTQFGMGVRRRRLRQRRLSGHSRHRLRPLHAVPQQRQRHLHRRHRRRPASRARLDHERGLVRLRQRRPARPLPLQLRRVRAERTTCSAATTSWGSAFYCIPRVFKPTPSLLFHNNGDGTFTEVAAGHRHPRARSARPSAWWRPTSTTTA